MDDRFVLNRSDGTTSGKEELIRDVLEMRMTGQTIRDRSLHIEGEIALVFGTTELRIADSEAKDSVTTLR